MLWWRMGYKLFFGSCAILFSRSCSHVYWRVSIFFVDPNSRDVYAQKSLVHKNKLPFGLCVQWRFDSESIVLWNPRDTTNVPNGRYEHRALKINDHYMSLISHRQHTIPDIFAGVYCPEGEIGMVNCPKGKYCPSPSLQFNCPAGKFCPYKTEVPQISCPASPLLFALLISFIERRLCHLFPDAGIKLASS